jgi:putative transposase
MLRHVPLSSGETYHIYNRGAHKQAIFTNDQDYRRFQLGLHLANHSESVIIRDVLSSDKYREPFSGFPADKSLVDVLAYTLMPNHFHLVLRQKSEGGITRFMKKIGVGYSMYYNNKYEHSGTLFQGPFKSSHIDTEPYFRWIFAYVHLNPVELLRPDWLAQSNPNTVGIKEFINTYKYSSYMDYRQESRPEKAILSTDVPDFLRGQDDLNDMLTNFSKYREQFSV